jgi:hypothetical protein
LLARGVLELELEWKMGEWAQTVTVTLKEGDTIGGLVTQYMGPYTESNIATIQRMNRVRKEGFSSFSPSFSSPLSSQCCRCNPPS